MRPLAERARAAGNGMQDSATEALHSTTASDTLEWLSRAGYVAKGVVYATVGVLVLGALYGAFGNEGLSGTRGAVNTISDQPFGNVLLGLLVIGLIGYICWRFVQGIRDTEGKGGDLGGLIQRAGFIVSGFFYIGLAWYAARVAGWFQGTGSAESSGDSGQQELTRQLMSFEWGGWLVAAAGLVFVGVALYQAYRAIACKFEDNWKTHEMSPDQLKNARRFARFGISARAVTFAITGGLLMQAGIQSDPSQARGLGYALQTLRDESYGTLLLTLIGAGLVCYGLYCLANARYRTVDI